MNVAEMTLSQIITCILQNNHNIVFTANEIAHNILKLYPVWCENKRNNSRQQLDTDEKLIAQLSAEISSSFKRAQNKNNQLQTLEERPRKFFYADESEEMPVTKRRNAIKIDNIASSDSEKYLYPVLAKYLFEEFKIHSKRIDEKRSVNKSAGTNRWLFPDVVALEIIGENWEKVIRNCSEKYYMPKGKLWSFEVKTKLDTSNLREAFFQAVSNSSWANFGYLVANQIVSKKSDENRVINELRILSELHGIGIIRLNKEIPEESEILIPACERDVDWNNANRLARANRDFAEYMSDVSDIYNNSSLVKRLQGWLY